MTFPNPGQYALIAGGSKGIGFAIAKELAKRNYNLILIARGMENLEEAKNKLESEYGVHIEIMAYDLSKEDSAAKISKWCIDNKIPLKILCNVSGRGGANDYLSTSLQTIQYMVRLNVESCMALTLELLPLLQQNTPAYILNVASLAGLAPIPIKNVYAATKSAVIFFSYALRSQLKNKNISVSCLAPGPVFTKAEIIKDTREKLGWIGMKMAVDPEKVGEIAIHKTLNRKLLIIPGTIAKIISIAVRLLPKSIIVSIYSKFENKN